jgi:hypothetical protein
VQSARPPAKTTKSATATAAREPFGNVRAIQGRDQREAKSNARTHARTHADTQRERERERERGELTRGIDSDCGRTAIDLLAKYRTSTSEVVPSFVMPPANSKPKLCASS